MEIYNSDCFEFLDKKVKNKSIDLFLLDLPYGQTACAWDTKIDLEKMWKLIKEKMKPKAKIIFFCTTKFGIDLINSNFKWFKYDLVWEKCIPVGFLNSLFSSFEGNKIDNAPIIITANINQLMFILESTSIG